MGPPKKIKKLKKTKKIKKYSKKLEVKNSEINDDYGNQSDVSVEMDELFESNENPEVSNNTSLNNDDDDEYDKESDASLESISNAQSHLDELKKLSENDPTFLKFLQEQDPDLLDFKDDNEDEDMIDEEMEADEESLILLYGDKTYIVKYNGEKKKIVDSNVIKYLKYNLLETEASKDNLIKATKILVSCFDAVTYMIGRKKKRDIDWVINDNNVFKDILSLCFSNIVPTLYKILQPVSEEKALELRKKQNMKRAMDGITYFKKWKKYGSLCRRYIEAIGILINQITEDGSKKRILRHILDLVDLHIHFGGLSKKMVKVLSRLWCTANEDNRILAFTILFKMCRLDKSLYPLILKTCYMTFVTFSGYTCSQNLKSFCFMQCSFAEMVLLDSSVSYPYVFVYLQQAAVFLRNAIKSKSNDNMKNVTKWQFIQGLYLWNEVIIAACKMASKVPGNHPVHGIAEQRFAFIQIVIGLYTHTQNQRYLLLRIHCLRILIKLQTSTDVYIPLLGLSMEAVKDLMLIDERTPVKKDVIVNDDVVDVNLKINNDLIGCLEFRKVVGDELLKVLNSIVDSIEDDKVFDACAAPVAKRMRYILKNCKNKAHLSMFKNFVNKLETRRSEKS